MNDPTLLPCPFCGHTATFHEMKGWSLYVCCVECDAEMNVTGDSRKVAAEKWNARVNQQKAQSRGSQCALTSIRRKKEIEMPDNRNHTERLLNDAMDHIAGTHEQPNDVRAWYHLLIYCPLEILEAAVGMKVRRL